MNNSKLFSDEAANIYERAIGSLLKKNMLLYFSFADYEEVSRPRSTRHTGRTVRTALIGTMSVALLSESHEVREGPQHL